VRPLAHSLTKIEIRKSQLTLTHGPRKFERPAHAHSPHGILRVFRNTAIDPAAILLQQQLAGGAPSKPPAGGYTGGALQNGTLAPSAAAIPPIQEVEKAPEFQLFKEAEHNAELLSGLNELRNENFLCDVTLMADDKPFSAHRAVLAATSPYLKTLFSDMSGGKIEHEVVEIRGVSAEGLKHIINYVYTSELKLNMTNIREVLAAAAHMQLKAATNFSITFLKVRKT
jgi:hypothetical protein